MKLDLANQINNLLSKSLLGVQYSWYTYQSYWETISSEVLSSYHLRFGGRLNPQFLFSTADRQTSWHAFRFLKSFAGSHVNMPLVAVTNVGWRVYTQLFLGVRGNMLRCPRIKGTAVNEWVHSFVDFCLITYPRPIPLTFQPQICKDRFTSIVFDVSLECCLFDRVRADNQPVLRSLQRY